MHNAIFVASPMRSDQTSPSLRSQDVDAVTAPSSPPKTWIDYLSEEDLIFVKRFILSSGSLKDLAQAYSISYPTVRVRLDR